MKTRLYSIESAARDFFRGEISEWTIRAWLKQRRLHPIKIGSRTFIADSDLDRFIRAQNPTTKIP
jgi:hypothetical protein